MKYRILEIETISGIEYQLQFYDRFFWIGSWHDVEVNPYWPSPTKSSDKEKMISWCKNLNDSEQFGRKTKVIYP